MSENKSYTTLSVYPEILDRIIQVKKDLKLRNHSQAIQVLFASFDIINSDSDYGGRFTEAVKNALKED